MGRVFVYCSGILEFIFRVRVLVFWNLEKGQEESSVLVFWNMILDGGFWYSGIWGGLRRWAYSGVLECQMFWYSAIHLWYS